jgi:protein-S-isoprenylcysteine O-methyltransferase Ste14
MDNQKLVAYAQVSLSALFIIGYFTILLLFLTGNVSVALEWKDTIAALFGVVTAGVGVILAYWFARQRPAN